MRSWWWFAVTVVGVVVSGVCYASHVCMDGHMRHPPYAWWSYAVDGLWLLATAAVAMAFWALRLPGRAAISLIVVAAAAARFNLPPGLGALIVVEPLLWLALLILCWRAFVRRSRGNVIPP